MTENIPQTSTSDRIEQARKALNVWDNARAVRVLDGVLADAVADALRAFITPPSVGESATEVAIRVLEDLAGREPFIAVGIQNAGLTRRVRDAVAEGVRAGIQAAHET